MGKCSSPSSSFCLTPCPSLQDEEGQPAPPKVIWNHTERKVLQAAKCDVLTIMDSCFAGGVTALVDGEYGRTYEYLGASDEKLTTPRPGRTSFTRALINALGRLLKERRGQSFTTLDLQRVVVEEQNRLLPSKKVKKGVLLSRSNENKRRLELRPSKEQDKYFTGDTVRAYLNLRIELQQYTLSNEELDDLAKLISGAVLRSKAKTRRIDHIGLQSREKRSLQKTAGHFKTWKNFLQPTGILPQATEMATLEARDNRPGVYAVFGWISPHLRPHNLIIRIYRPWPLWIFAGLLMMRLLGLVFRSKSRTSLQAETP